MPKQTASNFKSTVFACYRGYITQGIVNNLSPLFFVIYQTHFHISYGLISALILCNFVTQVVTDVLAVRYVDRIGYRRAAVLAHFLAFFGLMMMGVLPNVLPAPYIGLVIATIINGVGGGLIEVIISPIVESCPGDAKASAMSLLHSFYCWGQVGVVLVTTLLLRLIGEDLWFVIPALWSLLPFYNLFRFLKVPLMPTVPEDERIPLKKLFVSRIFLVAMLLMLCAGASELAMSQWSSLFAERALGVSKVVGDLMGPCLFAVFMGIGRNALRHLGRAHPPFPRAGALRRAVHPVLSRHRAVPEPAAGAALLRAVRLLREPDVAGHLLPDRRGLPEGRHGHVRRARRARRHRLLDRPRADGRRERRDLLQRGGAERFPGPHGRPARPQERHAVLHPVPGADSARHLPAQPLPAGATRKAPKTPRTCNSPCKRALPRSAKQKY